jgi:predicted DsbA family dithiol-disulfide isomerase
MRKLHVAMIHDIVCSWCPIGYNNIKAAINKLNIDVDFHFLPYELNPDMDEKGELIESYFTRQMGWNNSQLLDYQKSLVQTAENANVSIDFSKRKYYYNTRKAHLLMHLAERINKQEVLNELFIKAYFSEGLDINNISHLLGMAEKIGLDKIYVQTALSSNHSYQELDKKTERYKAFDVSSIPTFLINNTALLAGANSVAFFENALSTLIDKFDMEQKQYNTYLTRR